MYIVTWFIHTLASDHLHILYIPLHLANDAAD